MRFRQDLVIKIKLGKNNLPGGESNPGLPRDRRGYSPLYYRGLGTNSKEIIIYKAISIELPYKSSI